MTVLRVIGVGSPFGDDQAGWLVANALQRAGLAERLAGGASIVALDRPGAHLMHHLAGADIVVLIDAVVSGAPVGAIHRFDATDRLERERLISCHGFGVASCLELARALGVLPPTVLIYGIEIGGALAHSAPSNWLHAAAEKLAQSICEELASRLGAAPALAQHELAAGTLHETNQAQPGPMPPAPR